MAARSWRPGRGGPVVAARSWRADRGGPIVAGRSWRPGHGTPNTTNHRVGTIHRAHKNSIPVQLSHDVDQFSRSTRGCFSIRTRATDRDGLDQTDRRITNQRLAPRPPLSPRAHEASPTYSRRGEWPTTLRPRRCRRVIKFPGVNREAGDRPALPPQRYRGVSTDATPGAPREHRDGARPARRFGVRKPAFENDFDRSRWAIRRSARASAVAIATVSDACPFPGAPITGDSRFGVIPGATDETTAMHPNDATRRRARASDALTGDCSPPPSSPEEAFLAWLLWLPPGRDPHRAAHAELARLDGRAHLAPPARRLRDLFAALVAEDGEPRGDAVARRRALNGSRRSPRKR